jgi:prepilin-type N-terminal cleavage/methylation domain-containing protein
MRRARPAYTLLELMLVLTILVILAAVAYPSIDGMFRHVRLRAAADSVRAALIQARSHAMDEATPYRFAVVPGRGNYRVAPDTSDYWGGGEPPTPVDPNNPPLVLEDSLPRGIPFVVGDAGTAPSLSPGADANQSGGQPDPSSYVPVAVFLPDGSAQEDKTIALQLTGGMAMTVRLRGLTGAVSIQQQRNGGGP